MAVVRTQTLKIRLDPVEHRELVHAARKAGSNMSVWARTLLLREARRVKERKA